MAEKWISSWAFAVLAALPATGYMTAGGDKSFAKSRMLSFLEPEPPDDTAKTVTLSPQLSNFRKPPFVNERATDPRQNLAEFALFFWSGKSNENAESQNAFRSTDVKRAKWFTLPALSKVPLSPLNAEFVQVALARVHQFEICVGNTEVVGSMVPVAYSFSEGNGTFSIKETSQPSSPKGSGFRFTWHFCNGDLTPVLVTYG